MKKIKLFALAFVLGTVTIFATENMLPDPPKKDIRNQIASLLDIPEFQVDRSLNFNVSFIFDSEGRIVVTDVDTKNRKVLEYVRKHINGKTIATPGKENKLYIAPLRIEKK